MIEVTVKRNPHGIEEVMVSGHAQAAAYGQDIVCSAVSAVSFGTLNAVYLLLGRVPDVDQAEQGGGYLCWRLQQLEAPLDEKQQLLAESMVISLRAISERYGAYVSVHDKKWQGGAQP